MSLTTRFTLAAAAALLATVALTASAVAAFDQITIFKATGPSDDGSLKTDFKLTGLGGKVTTSLTASADATAVYACQNNSGNFPADPRSRCSRGRSVRRSS